MKPRVVLSRITRLQTADGTFRRDARQWLQPPQGISEEGIDITKAFPGGLPEAWDLYPAHLQADLYRSDDPVSVLESFPESQDLRFFHLATTEAFVWRQVLFRALSDIARGVDGESVQVGSTDHSGTLISGLVEAGTSALVLPPLVARHQPLAMGFHSKAGAQIVVVPSKGAFVREEHPPAWPTWMVSATILTGGFGVYPGGGKIPAGLGKDLLGMLGRGAEHTLHWFTNPSNWCSMDGELDLDERLMTWSSTLLALESLASVGRAWGSDDSLWAAYRSLGILQGIWDSQGGTVSLSRLLDPEVVARHAVPELDVAWHRDWARVVLDHYRDDLVQIAGDADAGAGIAQEMRNLVHGVRARGKDRSRRLNAMRALDNDQIPSLHIVRDIACLWWTAAICAPERLLRPGVPPWSG